MVRAQRKRCQARCYELEPDSTDSLGRAYAGYSPLQYRTLVTVAEFVANIVDFVQEGIDHSRQAAERVISKLGHLAGLVSLRDTSA